MSDIMYLYVCRKCLQNHDAGDLKRPRTHYDVTVVKLDKSVRHHSCIQMFSIAIENIEMHEVCVW